MNHGAIFFANYILYLFETGMASKLLRHGLTSQRAKASSSGNEDADVGRMRRDAVPTDPQDEHAHHLRDCEERRLEDELSHRRRWAEATASGLDTTFKVTFWSF